MAEELRVKGNAAFTAQKYEEAIKLYDEALLIDPRSVDTLNNRSAANFLLRRLDAAVEDARRSIKVSSNSKGFLRLGNALWQQGKLEQAKDAYDLALSAAPNNQTAKDNLAAIRQILASRAGNSGNAGSTQAGNTQHGASSQAALYLDLLIVALAVVHIVALFISGAMSSLAWRGVLAAFAVRQGLTLRAAGLLAPNMDTLKKWPSHFSSLYVLLCVVGFVVAIPPLHLLLAAIIMYTIVDISANMNQLQGRIPPVLLDRVNPLLQRAAESREVLIGNAAMSEAMLTFMLFFSGASMMFMMAYLQFIKFRYRSDGYNRMAFGALRQTVERLTRHQLCPPVVDRGFSKLCDLLHRVATG